MTRGEGAQLRQQTGDAGTAKRRLSRRRNQRLGRVDGFEEALEGRSLEQRRLKVVPLSLLRSPQPRALSRGKAAQVYPAYLAFERYNSAAQVLMRQARTSGQALTCTSCASAKV